MSHIVLTTEQLNVVAAATGSVEVRDDRGRVLAHILDPLDAEALALHRKRRLTRGPGYPWPEVEARMKRLQEIAQTEELTPERVQELLQRMRAGENV